MQPMYFIGPDVHKQKISYCVKDSSGKIYAEGWIPATRFDLDRWMKTLPQPWSAAMEATMFSGWIYDHLKPRHGVKSGSSVDAAGHCRREKEARPHRRIVCRGAPQWFRPNTRGQQRNPPHRSAS
jgi:hypothetical protein